MIQVSSKTNEGVDRFWDLVTSFRKATEEDFMAKRGSQRSIWMWTHLEDGLKDILFHDLRLKAMTDALEVKVREGTVTPGAASDQILSAFKSILE